LTSSRSEAASITKSASASAAKSWAGCRRASSASACSDASLPRATRDARRPAMPDRLAYSLRVNIKNTHRMSGGGSHFGDAGPHGAAADHRHVAKDVVIIYFPLNCGGRLARNALTPSR
jgi:hypothetical protein